MNFLTATKPSTMARRDQERKKVIALVLEPRKLDFDRGLTR